MGNSINVHFEIQPSKISTLPQFTRPDGDLACVCMVYVKHAVCCMQ